MLSGGVRCGRRPRGLTHSSSSSSSFSSLRFLSRSLGGKGFNVQDIINSPSSEVHQLKRGTGNLIMHGRHVHWSIVFYLLFIFIFSDSDESLQRMIPFSAMVERHRAQAKRSLMVQVRSEKSVYDLYNYCSQELGQIKEMRFHQNAMSSFGVRYSIS